ncbi:IS66 family transposase [Vibrio sp. VNB-15]
MKKTPNINPESQDVAELQAMVAALMSEKNEWKQERQSLLEQLKLAFDRQFAKRSEALKPYDESQGDLFNEAECEAVKEDEVEVTTTTTTKKRGKRYDGLHQVTNVGCLAHARRKFMDAKKLQGKGKSGKADKALAKIQKLYGIESRLKGAPAEERKAERQALAKPILDELYQWMTTQKVIGSSPLGKAIKYTLGQWSKLTRYIDDGHLSIDNNRAERAIKPLVIGRKNWLFSNTPNGADASAMLYSIIETAKANGLILYDYLVKCMKELAKAEPDIDALLPWNFKH